MSRAEAAELRADSARLDWALKHGFFRQIADGPMKGHVLLTREMIDTARGHKTNAAPNWTEHIGPGM